MSLEQVRDFLSPLFADVLHKKRLQSLENAVLGTIEVAELSVTAIGRGLASARSLTDKHAIKQTDRWLSNQAFDPWLLAGQWAPFVLGNHDDVFVNLDWTDFDADNQTTIFAALQTTHGRALPLLWKTVSKSRLKNKRNQYEDELLLRLREIIPSDVRVTITADRGFADQKLFEFLSELGFDYIIRLKSNIAVKNRNGESRKAKDWVGKAGRMRVLRQAKVTAEECPVELVVCVKEKGMKDAWLLVSSRSDLKGSQIKKGYGKRFSIEETFRDFKDLRLGMGLSWTRVGKPIRRDRLLFVAMLAHALLTVLGAAGEAAGLDRLLKSNTSKKRVLSLFRQGVLWYERIPRMPEERLILLLQHFNQLMIQSPGLLKITKTLEE